MKEGLVRTKRADTEPLSHTLSLSLASFWISRRGSDLSYKSTGQPTANFIYPNKWGSDCDLCFSGAVSSLQEIIFLVRHLSSLACQDLWGFTSTVAQSRRAPIRRTQPGAAQFPNPLGTDGANGIQAAGLHRSNVGCWLRAVPTQSRGLPSGWMLAKTGSLARVPL